MSPTWVRPHRGRIRRLYPHRRGHPGHRGHRQDQLLRLEGFCSVVAELVEGVDKTKLSNDIKSKVDAIDSFPAETEKAGYRRDLHFRHVLQVALSGDADERTLKLLVGQQLRDDLVALPAVSQVELLFARPYEISVEYLEQTLPPRPHLCGRRGTRYRAEFPGHSRRFAPKPTAGDPAAYPGQAYVGREFEDIVVLTQPDGTTVTLGEDRHVVWTVSSSDLRAVSTGAGAGPQSVQGGRGCPGQHAR